MGTKMIAKPTHLANGKFAPGNKASAGPVATARKRWLVKWKSIATEQDLEAVWKEVVSQAKQGEAWACQEVLNRMLGKTAPLIDLDENTGRVEVVVKHVEKNADGSDRVTVIDTDGESKPA